MNGECLLREPVPWSLRRLTVYRTCKRRFFYQYLLPAADPLSAAGRQNQLDLRDFLRENPPPLHWVSNLLATTNRALADNVRDARALETLCRKNLLHRSQLPDGECHARIIQLRDGGWFEFVMERVKQRPFTWMPVSGIERFEFDDLHVLHLPGVTFIDDATAIVMRPALLPRDTDLISDALTLLFIQRKSQTTNEIRIRKLVLPDDSAVPTCWQESLPSNAGFRTAQSLIHAFADEMLLRNRSVPFRRSDYPLARDPHHCRYCPFNPFFCTPPESTET